MVQIVVVIPSAMQGVILIAEFTLSDLRSAVRAIISLPLAVGKDDSGSVLI